MTSHRLVTLVLPLVLLCSLAQTVAAQEPAPEPAQTPAPAPPPADERQTDPPPAPDDAAQPVDEAPPPRKASVTIRGRAFGLVGFQAFTAADSFSAVLGTSSGVLPGGGAGLLLGRNLFVDVSISRFSADGTRVFVTDSGEIVDLGIDTQVAVTPIDVSVGWRFAGRPPLQPSVRPRFRAVPFVGGGFGYQQYKETSDILGSDDDVSESHGSYHVLGGVELPFTRRLGVSADVLYRWVPDAIGTAGVSAFYDDTDLGGAQVRFRVIFTF